MIKRGLLFISMVLSLFVLTSISAVTINEVELNPPGTDAGSEWIEFYIDGFTNLENYSIKNNDGGEIFLNGNINGYYVYVLEKQWLDNSDEKIFLYENGVLIEDTILMADNENNNQTWQVCNSWKFTDETKGNANDCEEETEEKIEDIIKEQEREKEEQESAEEIKKEDIEEIEEQVEVVEEEKEREPIILNPKDIKTGDYKKNLDKSEYAIIGFIVFCILLIILFIISRRKNESRRERDEGD
ncbi:MAG TPA: hypothetical protein ENG87_00225 [Candidatus Pacearchaeota archaeon]|nr:hypothetical protein [Candidatus Pacearchaeota archaeon]